MTSLDIKEMNAPRKRLRTVIRIVMRVAGVLIVIASLLYSYWWFYMLAPWRRTLDPYWCIAHSEQEYWREVQKGIHRGMWSHDGSFAVGWYGDKSWARWIIMNHVKPGVSMGCPRHSDSAMQHITNQDGGKNSDEWLRWWEANEAKSQEEWIMDGFAKYGVVVDIQPTAEQTEALLALIGDPETDKATAIPDYVTYNAFRWLRDSGFDPVAFVVSNRTISEQAVEGALEYSERQCRWPEAGSAGILSFGKKQDDWTDCMPTMCKPGFQVMTCALIFLSLSIGFGLFAWSFRKKREGNVEPTDSAT